MKLAILCGGMATRLYPLTINRPKSLVDVNGKPFIAWQMELLQRQGITDIVLCIGQLGDMIRDVVGNGSKYGVNVAYSSDGPTPLGTAGALRKALPLLGGVFFVLYGDMYLDGCDFRDVWQASVGRIALMTICRSVMGNVVYYRDTGLIVYDENFRNPHTHMDYIDYGLSVVTDVALEMFPDTDLSNVFNKLSKAGHLAGYPVPVKYHSIGSFWGLEQTRQYLKEKT